MWRATYVGLFQELRHMDCFQELRPIGIAATLFAVTTKRDAGVIHGCMSPISALRGYKLPWLSFRPSTISVHVREG
jgi:hypothetical protein